MEDVNTSSPSSSSETVQSFSSSTINASTVQVCNSNEYSYELQIGRGNSSCISSTSSMLSSDKLDTSILCKCKESLSVPTFGIPLDYPINTSLHSNVVKFERFGCILDISFWNELSRLKLDRLHLDAPWLSVSAICERSLVNKVQPRIRLSSSSLILARKTANQTGITAARERNVIRENKVNKEGECRDNIGYEKDLCKSNQNASIRQSKIDDGQSGLLGSFVQNSRSDLGELDINGLILNFNTVEDFRSYNRREAINVLLGISLIDSLDSNTLPIIDSNFVPINKLNVCSKDFWNYQHSLNLHNEQYSSLNVYIPNNNSIVKSVAPAITLPKSSPLSKLTQFVILSHIDLKKYSAVYSVAIPALKPLQDFTYVTPPMAADSVFSKQQIALLAFKINESFKHFYNPGNNSGCDSTETYSFLSYGIFLVRSRGKMNVEDTQTSEISYGLELFPITEIPKILASVRSYDKQESADVNIFEEHHKSSSSLADYFVCIFDLSLNPDALGWPIRNLLYALAVGFSLYEKALNILAFRDFTYFSKNSDCLIGSASTGDDRISNSMNIVSQASPKSVVMCIKIPCRACFCNPSAVLSPVKKITLWENEEQHHVPDVLSSLYFSAENVVPCWLMSMTPVRSSVFVVNLLEYLDKKSMQSNISSLNAELIRWRVLPEFCPHKMQKLKFLLLGAGTLGCAIARNLIGWGVRHITFVDNGRVGLSNPLRQCLYTYEDAAAHNYTGEWKTEAARNRLIDIWPDIVCEGICLDIPMPGHPRFCTNMDEFERIHEKLCSLICQHDVVFMVTDSRESRWLPSLIIAANQEGVENTPFGVSVGLGFDTCVIMRHGYRNNNLSCYFCNDVYSPSDSISNRTLDQQCTVTRSGLANLASSLAVELVCSLSQHPEGFRAPHSSNDQYSIKGSSCLGAVPHTIRASLSRFQVVSVSTEAFVHCICCSKSVIKTYKEKGVRFIADVVNRSTILESISGLSQMKELKGEDVISFDNFDSS